MSASLRIAGSSMYEAAGIRRLGIGDPAPWMREAECTQTDPELFFPPSDHHGNQIRAAKTICKGCPVRPQCRAYALERPELGGIWGGTTDTERRRMRSGAGMRVIR